MDFSSAAVAIIAGGVASVTGFGIGSILTPLLSISLGTKIAVAVVSIPHFFATLFRFLMLRQHVDRRVLFGFGITSAVGGLIGALLHGTFGGPILTYIFAGLLIFAGFTGLTGLAQRMKFGRKTAWIAGGLSGAFGGLVGNQGGIRSAAMLAFDIKREAFVATATAIGIIVDLARMPVYFWNESSDLFRCRQQITLLCVGVIIGTLLGTKFLRRIPENIFRRVLSFAILCLGVFMFLQEFQR